MSNFWGYGIVFFKGINNPTHDMLYVYSQKMKDYLIMTVVAGGRIQKSSYLTSQADRNVKCSPIFILCGCVLWW